MSMLYKTIRGNYLKEGEGKDGSVKWEMSVVNHVVQDF